MVTGNLESLLHVAVRAGRGEFVSVMVAAGADVNAKNEPGESPFHVACARGFTSIAAYLVEKGTSQYSPMPFQHLSLSFPIFPNLPKPRAIKMPEAQAQALRCCALRPMPLPPLPPLPRCVSGSLCDQARRGIAFAAAQSADCRSRLPKSGSLGTPSAG